MKNTTLASFIKSTNIPSSLVRAVVRNCYGLESFKEIAQDITNHGASAGFGNFIYYSDTVKFTTKNKKAIIELCKDLDSQIENVGLVRFIASFNCLNNSWSYDEIAQVIYGRSTLDEKTQIYNALAWFSLEEVARSYVDFVECK